MGPSYRESSLGDIKNGPEVEERNLNGPSVFKLTGACGNRNFIIMAGICSSDFYCSLVHVYCLNEVVQSLGYFGESERVFSTSFVIGWGSK